MATLLEELPTQAHEEGCLFAGQGWGHGSGVLKMPHTPGAAATGDANSGVKIRGSAVKGGGAHSLSLHRRGGHRVPDRVQIRAGRSILIWLWDVSACPW